MEHRNQIKELWQALSYESVSNAVGVTEKAVSKCIDRGQIPPAWYKAIQSLALQKGVRLDDDLFAFKSSDGSEAI